MKRALILLWIIVFLPGVFSFAGLADADQQASSNAIDQTKKTSVGEFLTSDGRFNLEAARRSGYQGSLDLEGFESVIDSNTGQPIFKPSGTADAPLRDDPDDIYWDNTISPSIPGVNGSIRAVTVFNNLLIVGGDFTVAGGTLANHIAAWDGSSWSSLGLGMNSIVYALTIYDNKLIAGGYFFTAGGTAASKIAAWDGTSWSALGSGLDYAVNALTVYDNKLIAGGGFTTAGGVSANYIAAWDGSTWSPLGSGMGGDSPHVNALTVYDNKLIAGGYFTTAGGVSANYIAAWDGSSWSTLGSGLDYAVNALTVHDNKLIAGGYFTTAGGVSANYIAAWDGSSWSTLGLGTDTYVYALTVYDNKLIAGGDFTTAGGTAASKIAAWDGSSWSPLGSGMNSRVNALTVYDNKLIAGGYFTTAGGVSANYIAAWDGSTWSRVGLCGLNNAIHALAVYNNKLIAGGYFTTTGEIALSRIAAWDGSSWSSLGSGMGGDYPNIYALTVYDNKLIAGGYFTTAGGVSASCVAAWDGSSWSALGSGMNGRVMALTIHENKLIAGGGFTTAGGVSANYIAAWDGTSWSPMGSGMGGDEPYITVFALTVYDDELIAGGSFNTADGVSANYIAAWDGSSWSALGSGMGGNNPYNNPCVTALTVYDNKLIAGGYFTTAGGVSANYIAAWDGSLWSPLGSGMNSSVYSLTVYDNKLIAGGLFTTAGGVSANYIAAWDGTSWSALGSGMGGGEFPEVTALTVYNNWLIVGGYFIIAGNKGAAYIAAWTKGASSDLGNIAGNIVDQSDLTPLSNATASVFSATTQLGNDTTDENGDYFIPDIEAGIYDVKARRDGFIDKWLEDISVYENQTAIADFQLTEIVPISLPYQEDFDSGNSLWWEMDRGFYVQSGQLCGELHGQGLSGLAWLPGSVTWTDYQFDVDLDLTQGVDRYVAFRVQDHDHFYYAGCPTYGVVGLQRDLDGPILQEVALTIPNPTRMHVKVIGPRILVWFDDQIEPVIDYTDNDPGAYLSGGIGLLCYTGDEGDDLICFDNIAVGLNDPIIHWVGDPGYENDAIEPDTGISNQDYVFRVKYSDPNGDPPMSGYPKLLLDLDGDATNVGSGLHDVEYTMQIEESGDYHNGVIYSCVVPVLPVGNSIQYAFEAYDTTGERAITDEQLTDWFTAGPVVIDDNIDLYIYASMIEFSDYDVDEGEPFQTSVQIYNSSDQMLSDILIYYYTQIDFIDTLVDSTVISSISPGYYSLPNKNWQFDIMGFYPIKVVIDPYNTIAEWNEENNSAVRPIQVGEYTIPGAIALLANAKSSICPGSYTSVSGSGWYYVPPSDSLEQVSGGQIKITVLETYDSWVGYTNSYGYYQMGFNAPDSIGDYHIEVELTDFTLTTADTFNLTVYDCYMPDPVCPNLRATLSLTNRPLTVSYNGTTSYSSTIYNSGNDTAFNFYTVIESDEYQVASYFISVLPPGESYSLNSGQITYTDAGTHCVYVKVDETNQVSECSEADNYASICHTVWPNCPDLVGEVISLSKSNPIENESIQIWVRVGNNGGRIAENIWLKYYDQGIIIDSSHIATLGAFGAEQWVHVSRAFDTAGVHTIDVVVDPDNYLIECNESNNALLTTVNVIPARPDFTTSYGQIGVVNTSQPNFSPQSDDTTRFYANVLNIGESNAGNIVLHYYLDDILFSIDTIGSIAAGDSAVDTSAALWNIDFSICSLWVLIDPGNNIVEHNENNNRASGRVIFDLSAYYPGRCGSPVPGPRLINNCNGGSLREPIGTEISLTGSALNYGLFNIEDSVTIRIYDSIDGVLGDINVASLTHHAAEMAVGYLAYTFIDTGWHVITAYIDSPDDFSECLESNNIYHDSIYIYPLLPDLWLHSEHIDFSNINPDLDDTVFLDATIWNTGEITAESVSVVFEVDSEVLGDTVWIDSITNIYNNNYKTAAATDYWIATDIPQNQHTVRIIADAAGAIEELIEDNNEATREILVGAVANLKLNSNSIQFSDLYGQPGQEIEVTVWVWNTGGLEATGMVNLSYIAPDENTETIKTLQVTVPGYGDSASVVFTWRLPGSSVEVVAELTDISPDDFLPDDNIISREYDFSLSPPGYVDGHVFYSETGEPVEDASIALLQYDDVVFSTTTDENGYYFLDDVTKGIYDLRVRESGYYDFTYNDVYVYSDKITTIPNIDIIELPPDEGAPLRNKLRELADAIYQYSEGNRLLTSDILARSFHFLDTEGELISLSETYKDIVTVDQNMGVILKDLAGDELSDPSGLIFELTFLARKWYSNQTLQKQINMIDRPGFQGQSLEIKRSTVEYLLETETYLTVDYRNIEWNYGFLNSHLYDQVNIDRIPATLPESFDVNYQISEIDAMIDIIESCTPSPEMGAYKTASMSYHQPGACSFKNDQVVQLGLLSTQGDYYNYLEAHFAQTDKLHQYFSLGCDIITEAGIGAWVWGWTPAGSITATVFTAAGVACTGVQWMQYEQLLNDIRAIKNLNVKLNGSWADDINLLIAFYLRTLDDIESAIKTPENYTCNGDVNLVDFYVDNGCADEDGKYATVTATTVLESSIPGENARIYAWIDVYRQNTFWKEFLFKKELGMIDVTGQITEYTTFQVPFNQSLLKSYWAELHVLEPGSKEEEPIGDPFLGLPHQVCRLADSKVVRGIRKGAIHVGEKIGDWVSFGSGGQKDNTANNTRVWLTYGGRKIDLHIYDGMGNHVGYDYEFGLVDLQIPGAYYYDDSVNSQFIDIPNPGIDSYYVEVWGVDLYDSGFYSIKAITDMSASAGLSTPLYTFITSGEIGDTISDTIQLIEVGGSQPATGVSLAFGDLIDSTGNIITGNEINFELPVTTVPAGGTIDVPFSLIIHDTTASGAYSGTIAVTSDAGDFVIDLKLVVRDPEICGDVDGTGRINILDITYLVSYLYKGGPAPYSIQVADVNSSGNINLLDITHLISYLYKGGPPPNCTGIKSAYPAKQSADIIEYASIICSEDDGIYALTVSTPVDIYGIEMVLKSTSDSSIEITNLMDGMKAYSSQSENEIRLGLIDINGKHFIGHGENKILEFSNAVIIDSVLASDISSHAILFKIHDKLLPKIFSLDQNYPNPFNPSTIINFALPQAYDVSLEIYNILGQKVTTLIACHMEAGYHSVKWDGKNPMGQEVASGVYFYKIKAGEYTNSKKMLLLK